MWSRSLPRLSFGPISDDAAGLLHANGRPTVPSSLSPVVNIRSLIQPVQCQQFKRALSVFLSIPISVILLRVARSHFMARAPSKAANVWRLPIVTAGMTQCFPRVLQCSGTHCEYTRSAAVGNCRAQLTTQMGPKRFNFLYCTRRLLSRMFGLLLPFWPDLAWSFDLKLLSKIKI